MSHLLDKLIDWYWTGITPAYRNERWLSRLAFNFGAFAVLRSIYVIRAGTHPGWTGQPGKLALELGKLSFLAMILWRSLRLNSREQNPESRGKNLCAFNLAAALSILIDFAIATVRRFNTN